MKAFNHPISLRMVGGSHNMTNSPGLEKLSEDLRGKLTATVSGDDLWDPVCRDPSVGECVYYSLRVDIGDGKGCWPS